MRKERICLSNWKTSLESVMKLMVFAHGIPYERLENLIDISYIRNKIFDFHNERRMRMLTSWGLYYDFKTSIDPEWNDYDKSVAKAHLSNWDKIIVGENGCPIDNEYELGDLANEIGL